MASKPNFSISQSEKGGSYQSSVALNNTLSSLYNDQTRIKMSLNKKIKTGETIFIKLCSKNAYKESEVCVVCRKKFGINLFKPKKHCKFCGNCICEEHSQKKRADPENKKNFVRICDICEMNYLYKMLNQDFNDQKKKLDQEVKDLQWQNDTILLDVQKSQNLLDELKYQKDANEKDFNKKVTSLSNDITKVEEVIRKYEKELMLVSKNTKITENEIIQTQDLQDKLIKEQETLKLEESETNEKINAIQQDIQQTELLIDEIDKKMAEMNMRKKLIINDPSKEVYISEDSLMEEEKRNREAESIYSRKGDRESFSNFISSQSLINKTNPSAYNDTPNEILSQIKKKKLVEKDENIKKIDRPCEVCQLI